MIDIEKVKQKIDFLKEGKTLLLDHRYYGKYEVRMNPQHNRIFVTQLIRLQKNTKNHVISKRKGECAILHIIQ